MTETTQRHMGTVREITTTTPTLDGSGNFTVTFGEFEKVVQAAVFLEQPFTSDFIFAVAAAKATNVVTVTVMKIDVTAASANAWVVAETDDVVDVTVIADCI